MDKENTGTMNLSKKQILPPSLSLADINSSPRGYTQYIEKKPKLNIITQDSEPELKHESKQDNEVNLEFFLNKMQTAMKMSMGENRANKFINLYKINYSDLLRRSQTKSCKLNFINDANRFLSRGLRPIDVSFKAFPEDKNGVFATSIFIESPKYLYKCYYFPENIGNILFFLHEVIMQKHAKMFGNACKMKIPEIYDFYMCDITDELRNKESKINSDMNKVFVIQMEYLQGFRNFSEYLSECNNKKEKLNNLTQCLMKNGMYHNDFHINNVMINDREELALIDFADFMPYETNFYNTDFYCDAKGNLAKEKNAFGGKRRRKTKRRGRRFSRKNT